MASWRQQSEQRLQRCRADQQREAELREAAAAQAEEQRRFVQQTEELRRQRQAELKDSWARQVRRRADAAHSSSDSVRLDWSDGARRVILGCRLKDKLAGVPGEL